MAQNNKYVIDQRRKRVAEMYLTGKWQSEIGKELNCSQQQVSHDLQILRKLWQRSALTDIDKIKSKELAKIDRLENEAWKAWDASVGTKIRTIESEGDKGNETKTETKIDAGDPRFLQSVQWCIAKRCEIFGLDAPYKIDHQSKGESMKPLNVIVDSAKTAEVLNKLIDAAKVNTDIQKEQ